MAAPLRVLCAAVAAAAATAAAAAAACSSSLNCSGGLGACVAGACECAPPWTGATCATLDTSLPAAASRANEGLYADPGGAWTWTASPVADDSGRWHAFVDRFTNGCGVLHYCSNGEVAHAVADEMLGPYVFADLAIGARDGFFDSGAANDVTVRRLPNGSYALFYMGSSLAGAHPNCSVAYDPAEGDRSSRRIGVAVAASPYGPWSRLPLPLLGPCAGPSCWDNEDVSNPAPIFLDDGSVVMLYKGRGLRAGQHVGVAWAPALEGPWTRSAAPLLELGASEDPWQWRAADGVLHALLHNGPGAGADWGGFHAFSADRGRTWTSTGLAYTGAVTWSNKTQTVLARRERPQGVVDGAGRLIALFNSAQACEPREDWGAACRSFSMAVPLPSG